MPGDLLVRNNTKVTALRLFGSRATGARVEALLLSAAAGKDEFIAMTRPAKKLRPGEVLQMEGGIEAEVMEDLGEGRKRLALRASSGSLDDALREAGQTPLPPYIKTKLEDPGRYQTVYATQPGSAAAPTAGLHFTPEILAAIEAKGVGIVEVTLDVSLDTFRPMTAQDPLAHQMHGERCEVSEEAAARIESCQGRVIAIGTTSVRTLETFAVGPKRLRHGSEVSRIYITPGFQFQVVDGMFTNFHMPRTTMLLMISAMAGRDQVMEAYAQAVQERYRFLSFGDSMLIL